MFKQLKRLFLLGLGFWFVIFLTLPQLTLAAKSDDNWYTVELIVFANKSQGQVTDERWPRTPEGLRNTNLVELTPFLDSEKEDGTPAPPKGFFEQIWGNDLELAKYVERLNQSEAYEVLLHTGWRQAVKSGEKNFEPVYVDDWIAKITPDFSESAYADPSIFQGMEPVDDQPTLPFTAVNDVEKTSGQGNATNDEVVLVSKAVDSSKEGVSRYLTDDESQMGPPNISVFGSIYLKKTRFLHLYVDLLYRSSSAGLIGTAAIGTENAAATLPGGGLGAEATATVDEVPIAFLDTDPSLLKGYKLSSSRRIKGKKVYFFDHPLFGVIAKISRFDDKKNAPDEAEEQLSELR
ncbi:MAG: peptidoglycan binding protein CsiV [Gammaproteobacteria bacterium]|nr:peptidoglycan binding protein CsiV [Gammaproteobacteria bacterium]MDH5692876.1 peptidoglycan binding protein CsiV [Gammaproteobacteria bacterium]